MARLRYNGLTATLGAALLTADTTITFAAALTSAAGAVPTITGTDYIPFAVLDEAGAVAEIIHLTAYTTGATTGTVTRAQESTTAAAHATGLTVVNGLTVADTSEFLAGTAAVAWQTLTLASGYASQDTFGYVPSYRKVGDEVQLRGVVKLSAGGNFTTGTTTLIATLPSGYRPPTPAAGTTSSTYFFPSIASAGVNVRYDVTAAGDVRFFINSGSTAWVSLDSIRFSITS